MLAASLTPPLMKVIADGYHLLVELEDMGPAFQFCVLYWMKGQESRVSFTLGFGQQQRAYILKVKAYIHCQGLFASPNSCCEAGGHVWSQCVPHSSAHTSALVLPLWRSLCVLSIFLSLGRGISSGTSIIERNQKSGTEGIYADFLL